MLKRAENGKSNFFVLNHNRSEGFGGQSIDYSRSATASHSNTVTLSIKRHPGVRCGVEGSCSRFLRKARDHGRRLHQTTSCIQVEGGGR